MPGGEYLLYGIVEGIADHFALAVADRPQRRLGGKLALTYPSRDEKAGIYRLGELESGLVRRELAGKPLEQAGLVE